MSEYSEGSMKVKKNSVLPEQPNSNEKFVKVKKNRGRELICGDHLEERAHLSGTGRLDAFLV